MLISFMSAIEIHLLETLSFFDPMSLEQIILDFDESILINFPDFTKNELAMLLQDLESKKQVEVTIIDKEKQWIKSYKKRKKWYQIF